VSGKRVEAGEQVTVTATVENTGRADGQHEVSLSVGGEEVATQTVSVAAGETAQVTFDQTFDSGGTYEVSVGDASAEVVVKSVETQTSTTDESSGDSESSETATTDDNNGSGIPGFGVGVSLVALLGAALLALRRR
jgi:PGF-CTERM protein